MSLYNNYNYLMRMQYPVAQNAVMDQADDNDNIVPGEWRNALGMHDLGTNHKGGTKAVQKQRDYLKMYNNSPVGEVFWPHTIL